MRERQERQSLTTKRHPHPRLVLVLTLVSILTIGSACILPPSSTNDESLMATLASMSTRSAVQATDLARQEDMIEYIATRGSAVVTTVSAGADPTPYRPVIGSVEIEGGRCCLAGTAGEPTKISVAFEATSMVGEPVTEMRAHLSGRIASEEELSIVSWEPFRPQQTIVVNPPINWSNFILSVQFRDNAGNLSPVYTDDISIEGAPSDSSGSTDTWQIYRNTAGGFTLQVPQTLDVIEKSGLLGGFIGKRIEFNVVDESSYWVRCQTDGIGDCPVMENIQEVDLGDTQATRITGYIGAIGGNLPQEYVTYVIDEDRFYIFTLWGADFDAQLLSVESIWPLSADAVDEFDTLMQTLKLGEQS